MSTRLETANNEYLERTASAFNQNADYTWSAWVYNITRDAAVFYVGASADRADSDVLQINSDGTVRIHAYDHAAADIDFNDSATVLSLNTWYYLTMRRSGSTLEAYIDAVSAVSITAAVTGRSAAARMNLGFMVADGAMLDARFAYSRVHSSALTTGQMSAERTSASAVVSSPWHNTPLTLHTDLTDNSGNGRGWTAVGTLSTEADPPAVVLAVAAPVVPLALQQRMA